ncbi:unnamed protein product, partial [Meganyctiphanes norvegica]
MTFSSHSPPLAKTEEETVRVDLVLIGKFKGIMCVCMELTSSFLTGISFVEEVLFLYGANSYGCMLVQAPLLSMAHQLRKKSDDIPSMSSEICGWLWVMSVSILTRVTLKLGCPMQLPNFPLDEHNCGTALASCKLTLKLSCNMELQDYPIDGQYCGTSIQSYAHTENVIKYHWNNDTPIDLPEALEIAQFDLIKYTTDSFTYRFATGNFSAVNCAFTLRRQNGYHVLQTYVPTILIVTISWVSFWLDPNAVPGRVTLGVTTLLTLTTLASGIRATLPPVSYVKAIDVWIGVCMIMVFGALLEFTMVNWLANKKRLVGPMPNLLTFKNTANGEAEAGCSVPKVNLPPTYIDYARGLDRLCRAAFPGFFVFFNLLYWPYYLLHQHTET